MKFISIAVIDYKMFRNMETLADNEDEAEEKAMELLKKKYVGDVSIIRTMEKSAWKQLVASIG